MNNLLRTKHIPQVFWGQRLYLYSRPSWRRYNSTCAPQQQVAITHTKGTEHRTWRALCIVNDDGLAGRPQNKNMRRLECRTHTTQNPTILWFEKDVIKTECFCMMNKARCEHGRHCFRHVPGYLSNAIVAARLARSEGKNVKETRWGKQEQESEQILQQPWFLGIPSSEFN